MQYEYDTYGNMTGREDGIRGIAENFEYDDLNRLVSTPAGSVTYDGKGNITVHDAAGVYGYDPARPYALSQITLTASGFLQDSAYYVQIKDYQGNVRAVLDQNHNVVERNDYYPYGGLINASDTQLHRENG